MKGYTGVWGKKTRREGARNKKTAIYGEFFFYVFPPRDIYVVGFLGISYGVENVTIHEW